MKLALAQLNPTVGDFDANLALIRAAYAKAAAAGAELVLTPELAITGYPPRALLLRPTFVARNRAALEALAAGVPVVQPHHGAFPEILSKTGGGVLCKPDDTHELAQQLSNLLRDEEQRQHHRRQGRQALTERFDAGTMADQTLDVYRQFIAID